MADASVTDIEERLALARLEVARLEALLQSTRPAARAEPESKHASASANGASQALSEDSSSLLGPRTDDRAGASAPHSLRSLGASGAAEACSSASSTANNKRPHIVHELMHARVTTMGLESMGKINCMVVDADGTLFACTVSAIWAISQYHVYGRAGWRSLLAGHRTKTGHEDGEGTAARFWGPQGIAVDCDGNLLVADTYNHAVRRVTRAGVVTTFAGSLAEAGFADGIGAAARFSEPWGIAVDVRGRIFVADSMNNCLRLVSPDAAVATVAGNGRERAGFADGEGTDARFHEPCGLALDRHGDVLIADYGNSCIRKVGIAAGGRVSTVAGSAGHAGGADGEGHEARFHRPHGIALDGDDNILVADGFNHRVRLILSCRTRVTTVAGEGGAGLADGPGTSARFDWPRALALDHRGHLLVADGNKGCLRIIRTDLPWDFGRVLYIGLLKANASCTTLPRPRARVALTYHVDEHRTYHNVDAGDLRLPCTHPHPPTHPHTGAWGARRSCAHNVHETDAVGEVRDVGERDEVGEVEEDPEGLAELLSARALEALRVGGVSLQHVGGLSLLALKGHLCLEVKRQPPTQAVAHVRGHNREAPVLQELQLGDGKAACLLGLLPVEGTKGVTSPILSRILQMVQVLTPRRR